MTRTRTGHWARLASACSAAAGVACGDLGDAQLPLPVYGGSARAAEVEGFAPSPFDVPPEERARAVVSLAVAPAAGSACPLAVDVQLPDESAARTLVDGKGPRAVDIEDAQIECRVAERARSDGFDVAVGALGRGGPWVRASGQLGPGSTGLLTLELFLLDGATRVELPCPGEGVQVSSGAAWFRTRGCQASSGRGACDVALEAIFENCEQ